MGECRNCRWWDRGDRFVMEHNLPDPPVLPAGATTRHACLLLSSPSHASVGADTRANTRDIADHAAVLETAHNFGCTQFTDAREGS